MFILYLVLSFGASIIGAISGIGGGVIIKPTLDSLSPFDVSVISFLSGNTVLAMTIVTMIRSRNSGVKLEKKISTLLALGGVFGGISGKYLFDIIRTVYKNDGVIGSVQSVILVILTIGVLLFTLNKSKIPSLRINNPVLCILIGIILGGIASFLGIGGGPINLAVLYLFFSMDSKTAALNSIYIIMFSQLTNLIFTIATGNVPVFSPLVLICMAAGGISGGITGSYISKRMTNRHVDSLFSAVMVIIICVSIYNIFRYITMT